MSDLTPIIGTAVLERHTDNPNTNHEAVPLDLAEKTRRWSPSRVFELRFSAAC